MRVELALDDGPQVLQRIALAPCVEESLTPIRAAIEQDEPRAQVIEAVERFGPPRHTWDSVAFQAATMNNVLPHLPADRLWRWAYVYSMMPLLDRANEREFLDVARIRSLTHGCVVCAGTRASDARLVRSEPTAVTPDGLGFSPLQ